MWSVKTSKRLQIISNVHKLTNVLQTPAAMQRKTLHCLLAPQLLHAQSLSTDKHRKVYTALDPRVNSGHGGRSVEALIRIKASVENKRARKFGAVWDHQVVGLRKRRERLVMWWWASRASSSSSHTQLTLNLSLPPQKTIPYIRSI